MDIASHMPVDTCSDEEQAVPLMSQRKAGSARLGLCAGLLLAAVGLVGTLTQFNVFAFEHRPKHQMIGLSSTMQAFAQQQIGRPLTGSEVEAIYSHVGKSSYSRVRSLMDSQKKPEDGADELPDLPVNLTDACIDGIHDKLKEVVQDFAQMLIEAFFGCVVSGADSKECTASTDALANFMDHVVTKCEDEGDFCNITFVGPSEGKQMDETLGTCAPVECHGEAKEAVEYFQKELDKEMQEARTQSDALGSADTEDPVAEDDCSNCTMSIQCARAKDAAQVKDKQHVSV